MSGKRKYIGDLHLGWDRLIGDRQHMFSSVQEHDDYVMQKLHESIGVHDTLVITGDVGRGEALERLCELECKSKVLALGNHDVDKSRYFEQLLPIFAKMVGIWYTHSSWVTHCPIHEREFRNRCFNIHAHKHNSDVLTEDGQWDWRYINTSAEMVNFTPLSINELVQRQVQRYIHTYGDELPEPMARANAKYGK